MKLSVEHLNGIRDKLSFDGELTVVYFLKRLTVALAATFVTGVVFAQQCKPPTKLVCTTKGNQTVCECRYGGGGAF